MGRTCFVPRCTGGYKNDPEKVSLFKVPELMLKEWSAKIPRKDKKLTSKDAVCEKHFLPEYIIRELRTEVYTVRAFV